MEIVTEPEIRTAEQARRYAEELQLLLRSIGASDADMERGQMRVEANVSLRPRGTEPFGTRVEVKNMNSFRAVERAIAFEIERQAAALDAGEPLVQETRGWSEERGETYRMRVKETSDDYRYFPEPDLPPLHLDAAWLARIRAELPELPGARRTRYRDALGLSPYDAAVLVADPDASALFEATMAAAPALEAKPVANWVTGEYLRLRNASTDPVACGPGRARRDRRGGRVRVDLPCPGPRGAGGACRVGRGRGRDHRRPGLPPDLGQRVGRRGGRRRPRGQPGRGRGLSRRQGAGGRLPRRAGHEGDPRPGQRGAWSRRQSASDSIRIDQRRAERVGPLNIALWLAGVALIGIGYSRARGPWTRYQALKAQDENAARYGAWRGGIRDDSTTGASVAMAILRRQAQVGVGIAIVGVVLVFLGFLIR